MSRESIKTKVAREVCEQFKEAPTRTLAAKLLKENPKLYKDLEDVRYIIRRIRGKVGSRNRERYSDKSLYENNKRSCNPFIPEPEPENWSPFILPKANNNILHIQDVHVPYHSKEVLELAIEYGINKGVNTLLLGYDFMDFYGLSRFEKDPRARDVAYELEVANHILDYFQYKFPKAKMFWRNGNHDQRLMRYLRVKAPELLNLSVLNISELLRFGERGVTYIEDKQVVYAGNLAIIHGDEYNGGGSGVNPARGLSLKANQSALCGHSHRSSEHTESSINGDVFTTYSVGCACGLHPDYAILNKWCNGFAHILTYPDGSFHVNNMKVIKGKIL